jgi:hypothetical protein
MALSPNINSREMGKFRDTGDESTSKVAVSIEQDISNPIPVSGVTLKLKLILEEISSSLSYLGEAVPGTLDSDALWRISKIETISGVTTVSFADGDASFDNIWDDRATLTYS